MSRLGGLAARAIAISCMLGGVARADAPVAPEPPPDPRAVEQASEANLVSNNRRDGVTFSAAFGGSIVLGDGVGRGPAASFRLGFSTSPIVRTFEVSVGTLLHETPGTMPTVFHNDLVSLYTGIQYFANASLWIRGAGGITVYTIDNGALSHGGVGGLVGFGVDLARWRSLALGIETFSTLSYVAKRGVMADSSLCLGLTYY